MDKEGIVFKSDLTSISSLLSVWLDTINGDPNFYMQTQINHLITYSVYKTLVINDVVDVQIIKLQTTNNRPPKKQY